MYNIVAYKPDSVDYCMGCVMAHYSSDFRSYSELNATALIERWAEVMFVNKNLDFNEAGYQVQIWQDGQQIWDETNCNSGFYYLGEGLSDQDYEDYEDYVRHLNAQSTTLATIMQNEKLKKECNFGFKP